MRIPSWSVASGIVAFLATELLGFSCVFVLRVFCSTAEEEIVFPAAAKCGVPLPQSLERAHAEEEQLFSLLARLLEQMQRLTASAVTNNGTGSSNSISNIDLSQHRVSPSASSSSGQGDGKRAKPLPEEPMALLSPAASAEALALIAELQKSAETVVQSLEDHLRAEESEVRSVVPSGS